MFLESQPLFFDVKYMQSIARSVASQIMSEEILASCSGGPRGNEQLRIYALPLLLKLFI